MPKLGSTSTLFQTLGYEPPSVAVTQAEGVQLGGSWVTPACTLFGLLSYRMRLSSKLPGRKSVSFSPASATPPAETPNSNSETANPDRQTCGHESMRASVSF